MYLRKKALVLTDGKIGCIRQAEGLAQALGLDFVSKTIKAKPYIPLRPNWLRDKISDLALKKDLDFSDIPDVAISCGASTIPYMLKLKRESNNKTYIIYVQNPQKALKDFDAVISMAHDKLSGENVIETDMALHPVSKQLLENSKKEFDKCLPSVAHHQNSIIIGGDTKRSKMTKASCLDLIEKIQSIIQKNKGGFFISSSRRTPKMMTDLLEKKFGSSKDVHIVDLNSTYNPYFAILAISQNIFVTNDSISMISEACASGKNVYIVPIKGMKLGKTKIFLQNMLDKNLVSYFTENRAINSIDNNTEKVADIIKKRMLNSGRFKIEDFQ